MSQTKESNQSEINNVILNLAINFNEFKIKSKC